MILFLNVYVTNKSLNVYDRGLLGPSADRLAVFKYSLASLAPIPWSHVFIHCELDEDYRHRAPELEAFVAANFPRARLHLSRSTRQPQWRKALEPLMALADDELVWFFCNDDHIFIDSSLTLVSRIEGRLNDLRREHKYVSSYVSHWPEMLQYSQPGLTLPYVHAPLRSNILEQNDSWFVNSWYNFDSVQIVNRDLLRYWWFEHDYGDAFLPRTDFPPHVQSPDSIACLIPFKELVRHYDGYSHVDIDINACPPLHIPAGFFENELRLDFSDTHPAEGWTWLAPMRRTHRAVDPAGVHARWLPEDVPLFWRSRVAESRNEGAATDDERIRARNEAVINIANARLSLPITEIAERIRFALVPAGDTIPIPHRTREPRPEYVSIHRHRPCPDATHSVIVYEVSEGRYRTGTIDALHAQRGQRATELIWTGASQAFLRESMRTADIVLHAHHFKSWSNASWHLGRTLNPAVAASSAPWITFVDSGAAVPPDFLARLDTSRDPGTVYVRHFMRHEIEGDEERGRPARCGVTLSRALFERLGRFDESNATLGNCGGPGELIARALSSGLPVDIESDALANLLPEHAVSLMPPRLIAVSGTQPAPQPVASDTVRAINEPPLLAEHLTELVTQLNWSIARVDRDRAEALIVELAGDDSPGAAQIWQILENLLSSRLREASAYAEALANFHSDNVELRNLLVLVLVEMGRPEAARPVLEQCLSIDPSNLNSLLLMEALERGSGNGSIAMKWKSRVKALYPRLQV